MNKKFWVIFLSYPTLPMYYWNFIFFFFISASGVPAGIEANGNSFGVAQFQRDFRNLDFGGNSFNMASASTLPITRQRPPLPPNRTACSLMKPEDFATTFRSNRFSAGSGSGPGSPNRAGPIIGPVGPKPHVMHR